MIGNVLHFNSIWVYSPLRVLPLPEVTSYTSPRTERYMSPSSFPPLLPWLRTGYWYEIIVFRYESDNEINCVCVIQLIPSLLFSPITTHLDNSSTEITRFTLSSLIAAAKERRKETSANLELEAIFELWGCACMYRYGITNKPYYGLLRYFHNCFYPWKRGASIASTSGQAWRENGGTEITILCPLLTKHKMVIWQHWLEGRKETTEYQPICQPPIFRSMPLDEGRRVLSGRR